MTKTIVLFEQALRLHHNPALTHAAKLGEVIPACIYDVHNSNLGGAAKWWLHHSLVALQHDLKVHDVKFILRQGEIVKSVLKLAEESKATAVYWNRCYQPNQIEVYKKLKARLTENGIEAKSFKAGLLFEPWEILNKQGQFFKVFTPFWKHCLQKGVHEHPLPMPKLDKTTTEYSSDLLSDWKLLPHKPDWAGGLRERWVPGEKGAQKQLYAFIDNRLNHYLERDYPAKEVTSCLSPHLHWGEISPHQVWHAVREHHAKTTHAHASEKFISELGWREFSYYLLYYFPELPAQPFNTKFAAFAWSHDKAYLKAWQQGKTGYPIVDAGMRELWHTGYMHNRVRMIVASFLTKHLLIDWRKGAEWFWDTLVDADLASNSASWQWVAGSGADAAPYFRIFNPILQGQKFDPSGEYVRKWVPELAKMSDSFIHCPWKASEADLIKADITLGNTYPLPVVDHDKARAAAMHAYRQLAS